MIILKGLRNFVYLYDVLIQLYMDNGQIISSIFVFNLITK